MPRSPHRPTRPSQPAGQYKHGAIPVIGLIGGIGAGKSRVAELLAAAGAFVIDADQVGHALLAQAPVRDLVAAQFGPRVLAQGEKGGDPPPIDRRALGALVFADPAALRRLEAILHPRMRRTFERAIARVVRRGRARAVVLDAAILLEAGWNTLCDKIVLVDAPRDQRLARLAAARGWNEKGLAVREAAQWPLERKRALAGVVVTNDGAIQSLEEQVHDLTRALLGPPSGAPRPDRRASKVASPLKTRARTGPGSGASRPVDPPWKP
jgi:dephospho-CoA kinase